MMMWVTGSHSICRQKERSKEVHILSHKILASKSHDVVRTSALRQEADVREEIELVVMRLGEQESPDNSLGESGMRCETRSKSSVHSFLSLFSFFFSSSLTSGPAALRSAFCSSILCKIENRNKDSHTENDSLLPHTITTSRDRTYAGGELA